MLHKCLLFKPILELGIFFPILSSLDGLEFVSEAVRYLLVALVSYSLSYRYTIICLPPSCLCLPTFPEQISGCTHANVIFFFTKISSMTLWRPFTRNAGAKKKRFLEFLWNANKKKSGVQVNPFEIMMIFAGYFCNISLSLLGCIDEYSNLKEIR